MENHKIVNEKDTTVSIVTTTSTHYYSPSDVKDFLSLSSPFPKIIHRTLLYDSEFPPNVRSDIELFHTHYADYKVILWKNEDVRSLLTNKERSHYDTLLNIQKSDFARYAILREYGGIYVDFDIHSNQSLDTILQEFSSKDELEGIVFIEHVHRLNKQCHSYRQYKIRQNTSEHKIRIANYFLIMKPHSKFMHQCIELLMKRVHLKIECDYDILYTTGPDVVSTVYASFPKQLLHTISLVDSFSYFVHQCAGHWRKK